VDVRGWLAMRLVTGGRGAQMTFVPHAAAKMDPVVSSASAESRIPWLLSFCLLGVFIFPADMVLGPIGAVGYVAMLVAIVLFGIWAATAAFGMHDPSVRRSPARLGLAVFWLVSLAAYLTPSPIYATAVTSAAADRWLLTLVGVSGIVLVMGESLRSMNQVAKAVRALSVGASICALVAIYQFITVTDPMDMVRAVMIGWSENGGNAAFQARLPFMRVSGSTFHPIELGVVSAMILPLSIWRSLFDSGVRRRWVLWVQTILIGFAAVITISRSAILSILVVILVFIPTLPKVARRWALLVTPACIAAVFLVLPGFMTTITDAFGAGTRDPSISTRVDDYPMVEAIVSANPWTGIGPGAYIFADAIKILDNQYLFTAVTMGLLGVAGFVVFVGLPMLSSIQVAIATPSPALRCLAGAAGAGAGVAALASGTFDSLSFPVFVIVLSAVIGLSAAIWQIAQQKQLGVTDSVAGYTLVGGL
jgi:putative inorganic carbon (HCO3(-)) transporter